MSVKDVQKLIFGSYREASEYFGVTGWTTQRNKTLREQFIIDKINYINPATKLKRCKFCKLKFPSAKCRKNSCINCSKKGLGLKALGKRNSKRMKGRNNPNYKDGKSKVGFRQLKLYRDWRKLVLIECPTCIICGTKKNRHTHHILPYALVSKLMYEPKNGITLCGQHHKELHRLQLDLLLLPILYELIEDVHQLREVLIRQPEFQKLHQIDGGLCSGLELIQVVPKNYHKRILDLHFEFAQSVLGL